MYLSDSQDDEFHYTTRRDQTFQYMEITIIDMTEKNLSSSLIAIIGEVVNPSITKNRQK